MLPELKIAQLRYFVLVAEHKSFHAAARQAFRTQPAISLALRELEQKLGQALVEKGGGRVELTPYGEHCLPLFRGLIEHHDRIAREAMLFARHEIGQVSIATVPSVASRMLPGPLARFVAAHPNVQVSIQDGTAERVQQLLAQGQVDFGISSLWVDDDQLEFAPIVNDQVGVVCRSDHPLVRDLCALTGPLVSTSANPAGRPSARSRLRVEGFVLAPSLRSVEALGIRMLLLSMNLKEVRLGFDCSTVEDRARHALKVEDCKLNGPDLVDITLAAQLIDVDDEFTGADVAAGRNARSSDAGSHVVGLVIGQAEAAEVLGVSEKTVETRLYRARGKLKVMLGDQI